MRVAVIGGWYGRGESSVILALALQQVGHGAMAEMLRVRPDVMVVDECSHMDFMAQQEEESPHPGERHRQAVNRVNSKRSRVGKAARWS